MAAFVPSSIALGSSVVVFSYGSNSLAQLRARCEAPALSSRPARLAGHVRIFAGYTAGWGGACASVAPLAGGSVHGSLVELTPAEFERLTHFEGGYTARMVTVTLVGGIDEPPQQQEAVVFVKDDTTFIQAPSPAYLTACHGHLLENNNLESPDGFLRLRRIAPPSSVATSSESVEEFGVWSPLPALELDIPSLVVCINNHARKEKVWVMPKTIQGLQEKLKAVGVDTVRDLVTYLKTNAASPNETEQALNAALVAAGQRVFSHNTYLVMRTVLDIPFGIESAVDGIDNAMPVMTIARLAVLINSHDKKEVIWTASECSTISQKFEAAGISSVAQLAAFLATHGESRLNAALVTAGQKAFSQNCLDIIAELLAWRP